MIDVNSTIRIRYGLRKGETADVVGTNFKDEKIPLPLRRFHVCFAAGDSDWYEASALDELTKSMKAASGGQP